MKGVVSSPPVASVSAAVSLPQAAKESSMAMTGSIKIIFS
jgi:hypothetical protein